MLRTLAVTVVVGLVAAACSSPGGASSSWSFGPSLPPASGEASGRPARPPWPPRRPRRRRPPSPAPSASAGPAASPAGEATPLTIGTRTGTELEFEPDEVSVPAGSHVAVTFENRASLPHNLTFSAPINVATAPVVDPGASETIEFDAPAPGDYDVHVHDPPGHGGDADRRGRGLGSVEAGSPRLADIEHLFYYSDDAAASTATNPVGRRSTAFGTCPSRGRSTRTWAASTSARSASSAPSSASPIGRRTPATAPRSGSRRTSSRSFAASWRAGPGSASRSSSGRRPTRTSRPRAASG